MLDNNMHFQDHPERYDELPCEEQKIILRWIRENIRPRKTPLPGWSSYSLKHMLERDTGLYTTNDQFKDAMLRCGYKPVNPDELNWHFCVSKRSPAFLPNDRPCI